MYFTSTWICCSCSFVKSFAAPHKLVLSAGLLSIQIGVVCSCIGLWHCPLCLWWLWVNDDWLAGCRRRSSAAVRQHWGGTVHLPRLTSLDVVSQCRLQPLTNSDLCTSSNNCLMVCRQPRPHLCIHTHTRETLVTTPLRLPYYQN